MLEAEDANGLTDKRDENHAGQNHQAILGCLHEAQRNEKRGGQRGRLRGLEQQREKCREQGRDNRRPYAENGTPWTETPGTLHARVRKIAAKPARTAMR